MHLWKLLLAWLVLNPYTRVISVSICSDYTQADQFRIVYEIYNGQARRPRSGQVAFTSLAINLFHHLRTNKAAIYHTWRI
jgi:hypothetical protein